MGPDQAVGQEVGLHPGAMESGVRVQLAQTLGPLKGMSHSGVQCG